MQLLSSQLSQKFDRGDALKRINKGEALTPEEEQGINRSASLDTIKTGQNVTGGDLTNHIKSITSGAAKETFGPPGPQGDTTRGKLDLQRTAGFEQLSTAAKTAAENLGGAAAAVKTLTTAIGDLSKNMPGIEKNATTAAGKSAGGDKGMDVAVTKFSTAIDKLDKVLNNALNKSSLGAGSDSKQRQSAPGP